MKLDDDDLRYGFILTRMPRDHEWWHGHLMRSNLRYDCNLLGRPTTMLFSIQKFGIGGSYRSEPFLLTLDGKGIDMNTGIVVSGDWGELAGTKQQKAHARQVRQTVMPLLLDDRQFQHAAWFIVKHLEYETIADVERMQRLDVPPFDPE